MIISDCTVEKVEQILSEQGGRVALMSTEGGVFQMIGGRYSKSSNFDVYLKGHSGDELRTDRVGRESVFAERPAITVALMVQPEVIRGLGKTQEFRGQGLLARFLYVLPQSLVGRRNPNPPPVPPETAQDYRRLVLEICGLVQPGIRSATLQPQYLHFADDAAVTFRQFQVELEPRLGPMGDLAGIRDWGNKLAGTVARLAGILHLAEQANLQRHSPAEELAARVQHHVRLPQFAPWSVPISNTTMTAAISIGRYLIGHAEAAFALMGMPTAPSPIALDNAFYAVNWLIRHNTRTFTRRDLKQANRNRFANEVDVDSVLAELVANNIVRRIVHGAGGKGGRPSDATP